MNSTERTDFETNLTQLLAGYDRKPTHERIEAYWRGLAKMPIGAFRRVVDIALSENGPEELPGPKACWQIYRNMRPANSPAAHKPGEALQSKARCWGNQWLFAYLTSKGAASEASLKKLIAAKDRIAESCESIPEEEFDPREMKPMLFQKFDEVWEPMTPAEYAHGVKQSQLGWPASRARVSA